jgi:hypothetical protein
VASSPSRFESIVFWSEARARRGRAATGDHTLLDGSAGRREGVLDAVLLLLELDLGVQRRP